jgi:RNA polymerase sigma factor (sigma-70 family)
MKKLVKKIENVSVSNFNEVYNRTYKLVNGIVFKSVNDLDLCKDLTQNIYIKVFEQREKFNPAYNINTWVGNIAKNYVIDYFRKKKLDAISVDKHIGGTESEGMTVLETINNKELSIIDKMLNAEQKQIVRNALKSSLNATELKCIIAYYNIGLSYAEIEIKYNIPMSSVKACISRGKEKLRTTLKGLNK